MTGDEVVQIFNAARTASKFDYVPTYVEDAVAYLEKARADFNAACIFPEQGSVLVDQRFQKLSAEIRGVFFVTRAKHHCVFFDPMTISYGAAIGPDSKGIFRDIGHRSEDPFEMHMA